MKKKEIAKIEKAILTIVGMLFIFAIFIIFTGYRPGAVNKLEKRLELSEQ